MAGNIEDLLDAIRLEDRKKVLESQTQSVG